MREWLSSPLSTLLSFWEILRDGKYAYAGWAQLKSTHTRREVRAAIQLTVHPANCLDAELCLAEGQQQP